MDRGDIQSRCPRGMQLECYILFITNLNGARWPEVIWELAALPPPPAADPLIAAARIVQSYLPGGANIHAYDSLGPSTLVTIPNGGSIGLAALWP